MKDNVLLKVTNLCKNFGEKQALAGLNMTVPVGSIYGFIGENGSGKSTLAKRLAKHYRAINGKAS